MPDEVPEDLAAPEPGSLPAKVRASMRHPIYVHSKMTIVDDDYVLVRLYVNWPTDNLSTGNSSPLFGLGLGDE